MDRLRGGRDREIVRDREIQRDRENTYIHTIYVCMHVCMYLCMTTSMYCLYVGVDYTYINVNALAQGIKSFLASQVWFQAVAGARTYGTDSPAITSQPR